MATYFGCASMVDVVCVCVFFFVTTSSTAMLQKSYVRMSYGYIARVCGVVSVCVGVCVEERGKWEENQKILSALVSDEMQFGFVVIK